MAGEQTALLDNGELYTLNSKEGRRILKKREAAENRGEAWKTIVKRVGQSIVLAHSIGAGLIGVSMVNAYREEGWSAAREVMAQLAPQTFLVEVIPVGLLLVSPAIAAMLLRGLSQESRCQASAWKLLQGIEIERCGTLRKEPLTSHEITTLLMTESREAREIVQACVPRVRSQTEGGGGKWRPP